MKSKQSIRIFFLMLALLMGAASETWAEVVPLSNIIIEGGTQVGETQEFTISNGSVTRKSVAEDAGGSKVTITVTPATGYYVEIENIIVQKLQDMSSAQTRNTTFPIADKLAVTQVGETNDYTFVIPTGFSGALVSVTFTAKSAATAVVTPKELTFNGEAQELVTLGTITGGEGENSVTFSFEQNGTYSSDIPIGTNAGTYTVWYKVAPDVDHSEGSGSVEVTINKAQLTSVTLNKTVLNTSESVSVTSVKAGSLDVPSDAYVVTGNDATAIGSYTLTVTAKEGSNYTGSVTANYKIVSEEVIRIPDTSLSDSPSMTAHYILTDDVDASVLAKLYSASETTPFSGTLEGTAKADGTFTHITGTLEHALLDKVNGGTVKNVIINKAKIDSGTNVGAITNEASGDSRIYNCGVLGTLTETKDANGKVTNITSTSTISGSGYVGSIVGLLDGTSRVINCYSFATVSGGTMAAGIVGNNNQTSSQNALKTIVVNCMFYGDIISGSAKYPVYGGKSINNDNNNGINPYCYFRKNATFAPTDYNRSWPAEEKNLTRFEYYRSILNSNKKLCTWWVNGTNGSAPTDDDVLEVGIAKWVLDPGIAPYPILKSWDKYPSIINPDPTRVWDPRTEDIDGNPVTPHWVQRSSAKEWEGKSYNTLSVTIYAGSHGSGSKSRNITITDMDTLNCDYSYYKIQLPYYNDVFGNPNGSSWSEKYGGNYGDYVVTGWEISGGSNAEDYNFADRNSYNGRIFAQGGYFYVPDGVTSIVITAHWGKAFYLANRGYSIDRVKVTAGDYRKVDRSESINFAPAGTVEQTFNGYAVYDDLQSAIAALGSSTSVYDQAIVLIGNHQVKNGNNSVAGSSGNWHPFTIMSADLDFDDEPDYCLQLQFRSNNDRPGIQPVRFDFLPVIELGLAVRHNNLAYAIGIMVPQGHFEITETALMHTTQFEWDANVTRYETESPVILNGGEFEQLAVRYAVGNRTSYFLLGGHLWFHRFAPGSHPISSSVGNPRLCPVSVIGGDFPEFYLSGLYRPDKTAPNDQGNPQCYISGGHFGTIHGAGYDKINGNVTFEIDHAVIGEFYGGGINGSNPIGGNIDVTIDNSRVDKYCGGPEVGDMTGKTVTTSATGTTFGVFYGGGNGGNSYYRDLQDDGDWTAPSGGGEIGETFWNNRNYHWSSFNPLGVKDDDTNNQNKGYHAEYEFEVFNQSNGVSDAITQRGFIKWIQFGITKTGKVENILENCTVKRNFYGGGNLASVEVASTSTVSAVKSTLKGTTTVEGSVFGAGYSATIPTFQVHNKNSRVFPSITAGVITDGNIPYASTIYEWTNDLNGMSESDRKASPTYSKSTGGETKWYCYTWNSLENLGTVTGNVELNIEGSTLVKGKVFDEDGNETGQATGGIFGGGDASEVVGNTIVKIDASGQQTTDGYDYNTYNVFGGGNKATVTGNSKVTLKNKSVISSNVFGGGNEAPVTGSSEVNIEE